MMKRILGMGNALVDIMTTLESDELLTRLRLPKGSMQLVDFETIGKVLSQTRHLKKSLSTGGSAANTIHGIARLGMETSYLGKVGSDEYGRFFREEMESNHIKPLLIESETASGRAVALVSPDSERTFTTFLGAAAEMSEEDIHPDHFRHHDLFHVEGYLVFNHNLILRAVQLAKSNGLKVSLDMASYNVVDANLDFLWRIINEYVDIIFANEEEARSLTGLEPEPALELLSRHCEIAVVKVGSEGSWVKRGDEKHKVGIIPANCLDTTGAGDLYASGFLYGLSKGLPLDACGRTGALLAGKVIEVVGAKIDEGRWQKIRESLKMMQ